MTAPVTLTVQGTAPVSTTIPLCAGWNLAGYLSGIARDLPGALQDHGVGTDFSLVYAFHAHDSIEPWKLFDLAAPGLADLTAMDPARGYWIRLTTESANWIVDHE